MSNAARHFSVVVLIVFGLAAAAQPARADFGCQIGKPTNCMKYAALFCPKESPLPDAEAQCAHWEKACIDCHARIGACFAGPRPSYGSPLCAQCSDEWRACMQVIDAKYWPNRRGGRKH